MAIRFNAPESARSVRSEVQRADYTACGIPLVSVDSQPGARARKVLCQFPRDHPPVAPSVSAELSRLGLDSSISFEARGAGDLQGRARAYQSLTGGGTVGADARRIVGVE